MLEKQKQIIEELSTTYNFKKSFNYRLLSEAHRTLEKTGTLSVRMKGLLCELEECVTGEHFPRKFIEDFGYRHKNNSQEKHEYLSSFSSRECVKDSFVKYLDSFPYLKDELERRGYEVFKEHLTKKLPQELTWLKDIQQVEMRMGTIPFTNLSRYKLFYRHLDEYLEKLNEERVEYLKKCEEFILQQEKELLEEGYKEITTQYLHLTKDESGRYPFVYLQTLLPSHTILSCAYINEAKNKIVLLLE